MKTTAENIISTLFGDQYKRDLSEFRSKLTALANEMYERGYNLANYCTEDDGVRLLMLPVAFKMGERCNCDASKDVVKTEDIIAELDPVDSDLACTLCTGEGCVDEVCWIE